VEAAIGTRVCGDWGRIGGGGGRGVGGGGPAADDARGEGGCASSCAAPS